MVQNVDHPGFADSSASVSVDASPKLPPSSESLVPGYSVLAKCMIGSGLLSLAFTVRDSGWIVGLLCSTVAGLATFLSLHLLGVVAVYFRTQEAKGAVPGEKQPLSFLRISNQLSPRLRPVVDVAVALKCLGAGSAYLIFIADLVYDLYKEVVVSKAARGSQPPPSLVDSFSLSVLVMIGVVGVFVYMCFQRAISNTKIFNIIGLLAMLYVVVLSMVYAEWDTEATSIWPTDSRAVVAKLPTFIFAFTCHQNLFGVIDDLKQPTVKKVSTISGLATLTGMVLFTICIVFPYGSFGSKVEANFLKNYLASDDGKIDYGAFVGCVAACVAVAVSFPLQMLPMRRSLTALVFGTQGVPEHKERKVRLILSAIVVGTTLGISVLAIKFFKDALNEVMAITGLIGGNMLCFVFPSWLYIQAVRQGLIPKEATSRPLYLAACGLLAGSLALYPLCLSAKFKLF